MKNIDVIIAGAGISGLLLGYELSKKLSVLILEKQDEKSQTKYWVTTEDTSIEPAIKKHIDLSFDKMAFISHELDKYIINGKYVLWNSNDLCEFLKDSIRNNGSKIFYNYRVYSQVIMPTFIEVFARNKSFKAQILVDCMGFHSPIVHTYRMVKILGYHYLYGKTLKLKKSIEPICLANVVLQRQTEYLEVFPNSKGEAHVAMIKPIRKLENLNKVKDEFDFIVNKSAYSTYFEKEGKDNMGLGGVVPVGIIRKKALNRIFLYGESAQHNPASTGTCLSQLFKNYKIISNFLITKIETQNLSSQALSSLPSNFNRLSRNFQVNLFKDMLTWNSVKFSEFLKMLECIPNEYVNDFLFGEIQLSHFRDTTTLLKLIKSKQYLWIKPFLKSLF